MIIGNSVEIIGEGAFYDCYNLKLAIIGNSVETIDKCAFECCYNLTEIIIGDSIEIIGKGAFECCENLTEITIIYSHEEQYDGIIESDYEQKFIDAGLNIDNITFN